MESSTPKHQVTLLEILPDQAGQRIDNFLHTYLKGVPKSHIYRILRTGEVRVNKGRTKPTYRLQVGDQLRLPPLHYDNKTSPPPSLKSVQILAKSILYEDNHLLIINKPAGMAVHGGSGIYFGVIEGLRVLYPQATRLELVHRLDRDTSGCLMIAKDSRMLRHLHELLRRGEVCKHYMALVQGHWDPHLTLVDVPLCKNILQSGERIVCVSSTGRSSQTQFSIEQRFPTTTLLRIQPLTGRTHQIRVHTAYMGHPIAGDEKYGYDEFNQQMRAYSLHRLFLHSSHLTFKLPDQTPLTIHAPLPDHLQQVLRSVAHLTQKS